jgi:mannose-6-phosphate isomerase-like protein (cupin superfamily)
MRGSAPVGAAPEGFALRGSAGREDPREQREQGAVAEVRPQDQGHAQPEEDRERQHPRNCGGAAGLRATGDRLRLPSTGARLARVLSYTIKNLRETQDSAPKFGLDEVGEAHFPREELKARSIGLAYHVLKPGKRSAFGHRHEQAEEIYVVLSGGGQMRLDEQIQEIGPLDAIRVAPQVARAFEAGPEGLSVLAFGPRHGGDGEILRDFWTD